MRKNRDHLGRFSKWHLLLGALPLGCFSATGMAQTIAWDTTTQQYLGPGGYGRIDRLSNGNLLLIKDNGGVTYTQISTNNGATWGGQVLVAQNPYGVATNGELVQLQNGSVMALWNDRPSDGVHHYDISESISTNGGASWGAAKVLYTAATTAGQGCWEPAAVQLSNGQVQVYFSNENPYPTTNEQEVDVMDSSNNGATWTTPQLASFRPGSRDGMPVPVQLQNGQVVFSIEDPQLNGNGVYQPSIVDTTTGTRWGATNPAISANITAAAPYLRQFPSGPTVLSTQSNQYGSSLEQVVFVGNANAQNFTSSTVPFTPDSGQQGLWNSLFIKNAYTVTAISGTTINGQSGLWAINGYLVMPGPSYYYDTALNTPGTALTGGNGTWSSTATIWAQQIGSPTALAGWHWGQGGLPGNAYFVANGNSVVTISGTVQASSLTFYGTGYQIAGTTLSLAGSGTITSTVSGSGSPIISAPITSTVALIKNGPGDLTLSATSASGGVTAPDLFLKQGSVTIAASASLNTSGFSSIGQSSGDNALLNVLGSLVVNGDLNIADQSGSIGQINISSGASVVANTLYVGKSGTAGAVVLQTGGAVSSNVGGDWRIGGGTGTGDSAAKGIYQLQGGTFSTTNNLQIGAWGNGTFVQTGGVATVGAGGAGFLSIGRFAGAVGLYDMSSGAGTLNLTGGGGFLIVGEQGTGTLKVGGTSIVNATGLSIGHNNGGIGSVIQTGGTINLGANGLVFGPAASATGSSVSGTYMLGGGLLATPAITRNQQSNVTGIFDFNGGTLEPTLNNSVIMPAGLTAAYVQAGGAFINTNGNSTAVAQPLLHDPALGTTHDGGLTKLGAGGLTLAGSNSYTGGTNVSSGTLTFKGPGSFPGLTNLTTAPGASAIVANTGSGPYAIRINTLDNSGLIDLTNNLMVVHNASAVVLESVLSEVGAGFNGAHWNGSTGITSSTATNDSRGVTAVGVLVNDVSSNTGAYSNTAGRIYSTLDNAALQDGDILVKYTYYGDANLDGHVDGSDYTFIDNGFNNHLTGWANGDFNYDGIVNGSDYTLIDNAFNTQGAGLEAGSADQVSGGSSGVPEPGALGLIGLAMASLRVRRRRICS